MTEKIFLRNGCCHRNIGRLGLGLGLGLRLGLITQSGDWSSPMAFKDTARWQEQLCDTSITVTTAFSVAVAAAIFL